MKIFKRNYVVYFYAYFAAQVIFIYVNVYLPVYFFRVLDINRTELAFIQIFAYSALLIKPLLAIYFDKERSKRKILIIISSFGVVISFGIFILNLKLLYYHIVLKYITIYRTQTYCQSFTTIFLKDFIHFF